MKAKKTVSKALTARVAALNEQFIQFEQTGNLLHCYFGSTWPFLVNTERPIVIKNQFVTLTIEGKKERFNINNEWDDLPELKSRLAAIKRELKKALI